MAVKLLMPKQALEITNIRQALDLAALNTENGWIKLSRQEERVYGAVINFCRRWARQMARQYFYETGDRSIISAQATAKKLDDRSVFVELERRFFFKMFPQAITERVISATKPFIISKARYYHKLGTLAEFHDLVTAGILGMLETIRTYDYQRGYTLLTLASDCVQTYIQKEITDRSYGFYARPPEHLSIARYQIQEFAKRFELKHGREPTDKEILRQSGIKVSKKKLTKGHIKQVKRFVSIAYPNRLGKTSGHPDDPLGKSAPDLSTGVETSPEDRLIAREELVERIKKLEEDFQVIEEAVQSAIINIYLTSSLKMPTREERLETIAEERIFALADDQIRLTLKNLGKRYGIKRERVRQEEEKILYFVSRITGFSISRIKKVCLQMNRWREAQTVLSEA